MNGHKKYHSYKLSLYVSPREIPWKHHACKRSCCRPTHKQTPSESRRIQRESGSSSSRDGRRTIPVSVIISSLRSSGRWSSIFGAVVCSIGSPFVLRLSKEEDGYFSLVRERGKIVREVNYVDKWDGGL
ncbi:hypothetical protein D8674_003273 [Pyrus ussuriensis x Pyrus communis]|uniref:Uncharacterized protein n=1 Tax=Pyrus ussuriensis x Pyrus communis TaxID=2448454 RepID=A0A5N5FGL1_9ROSA|nr:hypothetical protein D8674_003273 [Pyrus ussuriensis x Pyrus communis]